MMRGVMVNSGLVIAALIAEPMSANEFGTRGEAKTKICGGVTALHATEWFEAERRDVDVAEKNVRGLRILINTSACGFEAPSFISPSYVAPSYVASIVGSGNGNEGAVFRFAHTIYEPRDASFRLYLYNPTHWAAKRNGSEQQALLVQAKRDWQVSWIGAKGLSAGTTARGASGWKQNLKHSLYIDVDTSRAGLTAIPRYFVSAESGEAHSRLIGGDTVYKATPTGFRMYVLHELGSFTPAQAEAQGWVISWIADLSIWSGSSNVHGWHEHKWKVGATNDPTPYAQVQFNPTSHGRSPRNSTLSQHNPHNARVAVYLGSSVTPTNTNTPSSF
jgi:hypothetical protein